MSNVQSARLRRVYDLRRKYPILIHRLDPLADKQLPSAERIAHAANRPRVDVTRRKHAQPEPFGQPLCNSLPHPPTPCRHG